MFSVSSQKQQSYDCLRLSKDLFHFSIILFFKIGSFSAGLLMFSAFVCNGGGGEGMGG